MKKTTFAFIAMLLAIILALFSACNSTVPPIQPGEGISSPTEDNSFDESVPEESSEPPIETDVSANMSDLVDIPPLGTPSKLIPIVEFGFGDGDYELGYSEPDEYGFTTGPNSLAVNGNEILINDCVNHRLLVYRDGELIDKIDISEYQHAFNCAFTNDYYYIIDDLGSVAYRIDRQTKEFEEIDFEAHDCSQDNDYTWSFKFVKVEGKIYIQGHHTGDDDVCYLIDGAKAPAATFPLNESTVSYTNDKYILNEGNSQRKTLELIEQKNGIYTSTGVIAHKDGAASIIFQNMKYRSDDNNISTYHVYYKLSSDGTVIGRYIQFVKDISYLPPYCATLNFYKFEEVITDSGDLLVVNGDEDSVGIYKVEFGMDELPFDASGESIETQGDLQNQQSPTSSEINTSSEDMTYHPRVTREQAEQRALQMINRIWTLTQANKQRPADCTETWLEIPNHVLSASKIKGIPYCCGGGNGLEYLPGGSESKGSFKEAMDYGKIAGNVGKAVCLHAAGLDCSGYVASTYKLPYKYFSQHLVNAGENIGACQDYTNLNTVLDRMDMLVQMGTDRHVFIFIEQTNEGGQEYVWFYNCTKNYGYSEGIEPPYNRAVKGRIHKETLNDLGVNLTLHKMWNCEVKYHFYSSTQHVKFRTCGTCEPNVYLPHECAYSVLNATYHEGICYYCQGRSVEAHTFASNNVCTVCGYFKPYSKGVNGQAQFEQDFIVS